MVMTMALKRTKTRRTVQRLRQWLDRVIGRLRLAPRGRLQPVRVKARYRRD
jgi:hypothetical protein